MIFTALATVVSTAAFACVLEMDGSPHLATLLRLVIAVPILIAGLSRPHDALRVALAIGAATGAKLMIEPLLVTVLGDRALLAPLASDFGYGAVIAFVMLRSGRTPVLAT